MGRSGAGRKGQGGAVLIMAALVALLLFGFMGIALDLGRIYTVKTELQNAADAAALAGAKELNETSGGIDLAFDKAKLYGAKNRFNFASADVVVPDANIQFGSSPDGPWFDKAYAEANPSGLTFIRVDTGARTLNTLFMKAASAQASTLGTFGAAVAGRFVTNVTPIGICAISTTRFDRYADNELLEYGFRRGMAYDVMTLGPLGSPSTPYLVNPVDTDPATCDPSHSSANFTAPFVCMGNSTAGRGLGENTTYAIGNTGLSNVIIQALNSRFGLYQAPYGTTKCDPATAPPDVNVMQYCYRNGGSGSCPNAAPRISAHSSYDLDPNNVASWNATVSHQSVAVDPTTKKPLYNYAPGGTGNANLPFVSPVTAGPNNGVLWSYGPAYHYDAASSTGAGAPFTAAEANALGQMYNNSATAMTYFGGNYPATHPYWQNSAPWFSSGGAAGRRKRRLLNLLIIDCGSITGGSACGQQLPVLGIGQFFMQTLADPLGTPKHIYGEFAGLLKRVTTNEVKLYR